MDQRRSGVIAALGTVQALARVSSRYLAAIRVGPIVQGLGISSNWFFACHE